MTNECQAHHTASHRFTVGDDVAFAKGSGVARGEVVSVNILRRTSRFGSVTNEVSYVLKVANAGDSKTHQEEVIDIMCATTLDEAWKLREAAAR